MNNNLKRESSNPPEITDILKRSIQILIQMLLYAVLLFVSAGRINWPWGWSYLVACVLIVVINATVLPRELIAERGKSKENVKSWDKVITALSILPILGTLVVAGLDMRYGWTPELNNGIHIVGLLAMFLGNALFTWAMVSNYYFSTAVRIQIDRNHTVATGGPYRYVRHPGYVGFIIWNLLTPLIFGSFWAFIPAGLTAGLFVIRTAFEDRTLQKELEGYKEYTAKVRYRLLPGVW